MKIPFTIALVTGTLTVSLCQSPSSGGSYVVPPSPTPMSLINQSSEKVQLYTGSLNVSIPVHDLKSRSLTLPVSLSYNGSGNKVNDLASWIGLGWSLNAGGVITRVMRGIPDEFDGMMPIPRIQDAIAKVITTWQAKGFLHPDVHGGTGMGLRDFFMNQSTLQQRMDLIDRATKSGSYVSGQASEVWDTEPDEFYFNFAGYSGKFVFDDSGQIRTIPHQNLEITEYYTPAAVLSANSRRITSFVVTDPAGIKYTFGNSVVTGPNDLIAVETTTYSTFNQYVRCGYVFDGDYVSGNSILHGWKDEAVLIYDFNGSEFIPAFGAQLIENFQILTSTWYLVRIESPQGDFIDLNYVSDGDVKFIVSQEQDMTQPNLDWAEASAGGNTFGLYFTRALPPDWDEYGTAQGLLYPANLRHIPQDVTMSTTYNSIAAKRLTSIVAATGEKVEFEATWDRIDVYGGKELESIRVRNSSDEVVRQFLLGREYTQAPIEVSAYLFPMSDNQSLSYSTLNPTNPRWIGFYEYQGAPISWGSTWGNMAARDHFRMYLSTIDEVSGPTPVKLYDFQYDNNPDMVLPRRMSFQQDWYGFYNLNSVGHRFTHETYSDTEIFGSILLGQPFTFTMKQPGDEAWSNGLFFASEDRAPNYEFANRTWDFSRTQAGILRSISYPTGGKKEFVYGFNSVGGNSVGGLVIKEIKSYPNVNLPGYESVFYNYNQGAYAMPYYDQRFIYAETNFVDFSRRQVHLSTASHNAQVYTKGGIVGYGQVEEFRPGLGKTIYEFEDPANYPNSQETAYKANLLQCTACAGYPFAPKSDNDHKRGNLSRVTVKDNGNKTLQTTAYQWAINPEGFVPVEIWGIKPGKWAWQGSYFDHIAGFYKYRNDWVTLFSTTDEIYDQADPGNDSKKATVVTNYSYIPQGGSVAATDLLQRKVSKQLPTGELLVNKLKYPSDYTVSASATDQAAKAIYLLKQAKVDNVPIEAVTYLERAEGEYLMAGALTLHKEFQVGSGQVHPWQVYRLKPGASTMLTGGFWSDVNGSNIFQFSSSLYKLTDQFNDYQFPAKPTNHDQEDGINRAYVWGHNGSLLTSLTQNNGQNGAHSQSVLYTPLVGVTRITDANERNADFVYDEYHRLSLEKDHDTNILARYRYHYRTQAAGFTNLTVTNFSCNLTGQTVTLNSAESVPGASTYIWTFGDGTGVKTTVGVVDKVYSSPGVYAVTCVKENDEYATLVATGSITIYAPITSWSIEADGPTSYDVCNANDPSAGTLCLITNGTAANIAWEESFNGGSYYPMGSGQCMGVPLGFGSQGIVGGWTIRCTFTDSCGNVFTEYISLSNYASNPLCEFY